MVKANERFRRGMIVRTWFDTGALGCSMLYGQVISAGPCMFTVQWESGIRNRVRQGSSTVTFVKPGEWRPAMYTSGIRRSLTPDRARQIVEAEAARMSGAMDRDRLAPAEVDLHCWPGFNLDGWWYRMDLRGRWTATRKGGSGVGLGDTPEAARAAAETS